LNNSDTVKEIVSKLKKREIRPSSKLFKETESAKKTLEEIIDDDAGVDDLIFQPSLGKSLFEHKTWSCYRKKRIWTRRNKGKDFMGATG